jgi:hypothetical protein
MADPSRRSPKQPVSYLQKRQANQPQNKPAEPQDDDSDSDTNDSANDSDPDTNNSGNDSDSEGSRELKNDPFLHPGNIKGIVTLLAKKLCMQNIGREFTDKITDVCDDYRHKYPEKTVADLNKIVFDYLYASYSPQQSVQKFFDIAQNKKLVKQGIPQSSKQTEHATDITDPKILEEKKKQAQKKTDLGAEIQASRDNRQTITTVYNFTVDSRHRDPNSWPSASRYLIKFERNPNSSVNQVGFLNNIDGIIRNVRRIEMTKAVVPNIFKPNIDVTDNYLLLGLDEIIGQHFNSSPVGKNIFGRLQFDLRLPINTNFLYIEPVECYRTYTPEPLSTPLTGLTINILNFNGNQYSFGSDAFQVRYWMAFGAITVITTWLPTGLTSNDKVVFRSTTNAKLDANYDGYSINVITPTTFTVAENSTTVSAGIAPNIGGPPINTLDPLNSAGYPYPTIPPNDPANPIDKFGYVLDLKKQNAFTFKIYSEKKIDITQTNYVKSLNY